MEQGDQSHGCYLLLIAMDSLSLFLSLFLSLSLSRSPFLLLLTLDFSVLVCEEKKKLKKRKRVKKKQKEKRNYVCSSLLSFYLYLKAHTRCTVELELVPGARRLHNSWPGAAC